LIAKALMDGFVCCANLALPMYKQILGASHRLTVDHDLNKLLS
jgi:hypothetical protein